MPNPSPLACGRGGGRVIVLRPMQEKLNCAPAKAGAQRGKAGCFAPKPLLSQGHERDAPWLRSSTESLSSSRMREGLGAGFSCPRLSPRNTRVSTSLDLNGGKGRPPPHSYRVCREMNGDDPAESDWQGDDYRATPLSAHGNCRAGSESITRPYWQSSCAHRQGWRCLRSGSSKFPAAHPATGRLPSRHSPGQ